MQDRGYLTPKRKSVEEEQVNQAFLIKNVITYLIHYVDEGLSIARPEAISYIGFPSRENRLDEGWEFILWYDAGD